jgi:hypothetical protein
MRVTNLAVEDYFNFPNGLADGHEVDATVSFDVVWGDPVTRRVEVEHGTNGNRFAGEFVEDHATVTWSGSNELGFRFRSNSGDFSTSAPGRAFAELGRERNGIFVEEGEDEDASALGQALGKRVPQGEESATDRFFAALSARLGGGELLVNKSVDIEAPGAGQLTISGDRANRVFEIGRGESVTIAGRTIADDGSGTNYRLNRSSVRAHRPGAATVLEGATSGQAALDWFFASADEVRNLKPGEIVTAIP